jgi:hypothetical protein
MLLSVVESGVLVESQKDLPGVYKHEVEYPSQGEATIARKSKTAINYTHGTQSDVEY